MLNADRSPSPSMFDAWPDELLLRVLDELAAADDPAHILRGVSPVSRRWRRVATDDGLWLRICARILTRFTTTNSTASGDSESTACKFKREIWLGSPSPGTMVDFWRRFVRVWAPRLGWWADTDGAHGALFRIAADPARGALQCDRLLLANDMDESSDADADKPGGVPPGVVLERGVLSVLTDAAARAYLDIHLLRPRLLAREVFSARYDCDAPEATALWAAADARLVHPSVIYFEPQNESQMPWATNGGGWGRPFPPPALLPAIRCDPLEQQIRCLNSLYGRRLAPLLAPSEVADNPDDPVRAGWYAGTYGAHGCELVFVHTVSQSEAHSLDEFPGDVDALPPSAGRRIEGVKITGDPNVPKGQRSFVGFLDSPKARGFSPSPTSTSSSCSSPASPTTRTHTIPTHSSRHPLAPWPLTSSGAHVLPDVYTPGSSHRLSPHELSSHSLGLGATAPGVGRIAARGFREPRWTPCVVHVAARGEIELLWTEMGIVTTFRRLDL